MPVERSKPLKRSASAGNQFVWTSMAEPTNGSEVSLSSPMSPWSVANTPPPLVDNVSEFIMFPPPEDSDSVPKRQPHSKKKPSNHIPRPPNAFILFRSAFVKNQHVSTAVETNHSTLSKIIGMYWQKLSEEERQIWHEKAKVELEEHKRKFPKYSFKPVQTKAKGAPSEKRKVREVEPKDIKRCAKIAQLMAEGKKGDELNAAVEEFDKHHIPEIVTRFEAPITAHAFRRSSSVPIPDTENSRSNNSFLQPVASSPSTTRKRCTSSKRPIQCSLPSDVLTPEIPSISANAYPTVHSQAVPSMKEEPLFSFGNFSFDNVARSPPTFACDPLTNGLEVDTFADEWASTPPSPTSPSSPSYMMSPSPVLSAPATPSYSGSFDSLESELDATFSNFTPEFPLFSQSGGVSHESAGMCGSGVDNIPISSMDGIGIYTPYESLPEQHHQYNQHYDDHHSLPQQVTPLGYFDFDFSAFVNSVPQYAM